MGKVKELYQDIDTGKGQDSTTVEVRRPSGDLGGIEFKHHGVGLYDISKIDKFTRLGVFIKRRPLLYYILNLTWGLPLTLVGFLVTLFLLPFGKVTRYKYSYYICLNRDMNAGLSIGTVFITGRYSSDNLKTHEFGHTVQNAILGPFMLLLVSIPSLIRFWYRRLKLYLKPSAVLPRYNDVWFERTATDIGNYGKAWEEFLNGLFKEGFHNERQYEGRM